MQNEPQLSAEQLQLVEEWWDKNYLDFGIGNNSTKLGLIIGLLATALEEQRKDVAKIAQNLFPITGENAKKHNKAVLRLSNYALNGKGTE